MAVIPPVILGVSIANPAGILGKRPVKWDQPGILDNPRRRSPAAVVWVVCDVMVWGVTTTTIGDFMVGLMGVSMD